MNEWWFVDALTCNKRFLPFRELPILEDIVDEWDVVVGMRHDDPVWRELSARLRSEEPEFFTHLKNGWKIDGQVFPQHELVWINDRQSPQEYWDTVIHEFLHAYEHEAIEHARALMRNDQYSQTRLWQETFAKYGVRLPLQYFPEAQIIDEASIIIKTRPDIKEFFRIVYPQLGRDNV